MNSSQQYSLWFVNQSVSAGKVCVYQDDGNVTFSQSNPKVLAWMLTGANPSVKVNFKWGTDYDFAWFDYGSPRSQEIIDANLTTGESVTFAMNQYGYYFKTPNPNAPSGQLSVQSDGSIPAINTAVVGIGMHDSGTFSFPAGPNLNFVFTPVQDADLVYWISFGQYPFEVNDPIDVSTLNTSAQISFTSGVYTMTAVLNSQNQWSIYPGLPHAADVESVSQQIVYEAGKGILSAVQE